MAPFELKNIGGEYDVTKKNLKTDAKVKLGDSVTLKVKLPNTIGAVTKPNFEAEWKDWQAKFDVKTKDIEIEKKWKLTKGELKIKQKVPGQKWELVPSPEVKWKGNVVKGKKFTWEVEPAYCFQARMAKIESVVEVNGGKQKLKVEADQRDGAKAIVGTLSTKINKSWAKQLSAKYSVKAGPSLVHEVEPSKKVSLKSTLGINNRDLKIVAEVKPGKVAGVKPKLTLEGKVTANAPTKPTGIIAGLSLDV
ncbi:hypothetical protein HYH03_018493 [Edaphochlamys debaryana]|uniref:Uncharacterized protein n=1 Tax=Edaphochlamys debaryana TaxID=47281 RepID=A0A835XEH2_9CHLO|nr:hypothetical protein HYH03_018493 [Edaphochlamys debaryana]|eukprot:KAG2482568.1 hypothetical protein HYH03_018493 [Edaphochlamys debaryana]